MDNPLLRVALEGDERGVQQALAANPQAAFEVLAAGLTPLHYAAARMNSRAVALLLAAAPQAASVVGGLPRMLPLHLAAQHGRVEVVELLLRAAPETLNAPDQHGYTALYYAASIGRESVVAHFLAAGAAPALEGGQARLLPLQMAAFVGHTAVVQQLLDAAPWTILSRTSIGSTPLGLALQNCHLDAAPCLVRAAPAVQPTLTELESAASQPPALMSVRPSGRVALLLFADLAARLPLTEAEWQCVPAPCPDLARALPAVLARSAAEAGWLVGRLAAEQRERLRTAALCLHRAALLPAGVTPTILARGLA